MQSLQEQHTAAQQQEAVINGTLHELQILQTSAAELREARGLTEAEVRQMRQWSTLTFSSRAKSQLLLLA